MKVGFINLYERKLEQWTWDDEVVRSICTFHAKTLHFYYILLEIVESNITVYLTILQYFSKPVWQIKEEMARKDLHQYITFAVSLETDHPTYFFFQNPKF